MSIILHISCRNIDFSERGTAPLKRGLHVWKCTLHSCKGHGATVQGILHVFFGYCPCKITLHCPKGRLLFIQKGMFVCRYGDVAILLKSCSIFCRSCVLLKGHCGSIYCIYGRVNTWTLLQAIHAL